MANLITTVTEVVFDQVAKIGTELREGAMKNSSFRPIDWYIERLNVLTGDFMLLSAEFARMKAARENNEISAYIISKSDADVAGGKFVSAVAEREARNKVSEFVTAEKILEAYKDAAEQGILTCKKIIDVLTLELQREAK